MTYLLPIDPSSSFSYFVFQIYVSLLVVNHKSYMTIWMQSFTSLFFLYPSSVHGPHHSLDKSFVSMRWPGDLGKIFNVSEILSSVVFKSPELHSTTSGRASQTLVNIVDKFLRHVWKALGPVTTSVRSKCYFKRQNQENLRPKPHRIFQTSALDDYQQNQQGSKERSPSDPCCQWTDRT